MFAKVDVNGKDAHPLFTWLKGEKKGLLGGKIKWNFTKFLIGRDGQVIDRYAPTTEPKDIADDIRAALAAPGRLSAWFLLVPVGVLLGFLAFVWHRLAVAPGWRPRWVRWAVALVLVALTALALAGFDLWGGWFTPAQLRPAVWVGQAFLAACLYLFLGLVPVWLVCVGIWLVRWRHDHGRVGRRRLNRVASPLVVAVAVGVTAYGAVEAATPSVTRFEVASPQLPPQFDGVRVALVTDLHAGAVRSASFTRQVVDLVNAEHPDLVVVAGDLVDGTAARYSPEIAPLADLEAPLGVYATTGNHEMFLDTANWVTAFEDVGLTMLQNSARATRARRRHDHPRRGARPHRRGPVGARLRRRARRHGCRCLHPARRAPAAPGLRRRGAWRRPAAVRAHPRRADVADQLPRAAPAADARGQGHRRRHDRGHLPGRRRLGPGDPGRGPARGPDHHPEALMSGSGVVVGDDGLARPVWASVDPLLRDYYDTEWGLPVRDERGMFERLTPRGVPVGPVLGDDPAQAPGVPGGVRRVRPRGRGGLRRRPTSSG